MAEEQNRSYESFDQDSMMIYIDPKLMSSLNDMAEKKQEDLKALEASAEEGDLDAQYRLGRSYYYGEDGAPKDGKKAFEWFSRAAEGGSIAAQYYLGLCCSREVGTDKDLVRAAELFTAAAEEGYPPAITELGLCYELGHGVEMDKGRAAELYQEGADQDYAPAQCNLGFFYYQGISVKAVSYTHLTLPTMLYV